MNNLKTFLLSAIVVIFSFTLNAQSNETEIQKNSFSVNILGPSSVVGITYERIVKNSIILEVGVGLIGVGAGISFYPFNIKASKLSPYVGAKFSTAVLVDVGGGYVGYIPLGVTFFSKHKINIGLDIGPAYGQLSESGFAENEETETTIYLYGNLKIGLRF